LQKFSTKNFVLLGICLMLGSTSLRAQLVPHLSLLSQWNRHAGPYGYNSLWGWSGNGHEYAILGSLDSIYFFDVTDPTKPKLCDARAGRNNDSKNREFKTYKHYCYAVGDAFPSSLQIFDLNYLPDSVHKVYDNDTLSTAAHNLWFDHDRLYLAWNKKNYTKNGVPIDQVFPMTVVSVANPEVPVFMANLKSPYIVINGQKKLLFDYVHDMFVRNDTAYCSCGEGGLYIFNYKNPNNPVLLQAITDYENFTVYNHSNYLSDDGNYLVFADETPGIKVKLFDVSALKDTTDHDPALNVKCLFGSHSDEGSTAHNPFIKGNLIFTSYYQDGVVVWDRTDPNNVKEIASYDTYPQNDNVAVTNGKYSGLLGCWNVYPFFSSGTIIASDMANGLFVLKMDSVSAINGKYISDNELNIKIMQNPFHDNILMRADAQQPEDITISIHDMLGREWYSSRYHCAQGESMISIPSAGIDANLLLLTVSSPSGTYSRKLVKE